jgi:hypothetical protein
MSKRDSTIKTLIQELDEEITWVMAAVEPITTLGLRLRLIERLGTQLDELRKELK